MNSTELINQAKNYAYSIHGNDSCALTYKTKVEHIEYVVQKVTELGLKDDDLIILAYLHDVLDHATDSSTRNRISEDIKNMFGIHMLKLVEEVSDNFRIEDIGNPSTNEAFNKRISKIKSPEAIEEKSAKVILAEKVCNLNDMLEELRKVGKSYWEDHNLKKSDMKQYYELIYDTISYRCSDDRRLRKMINDFDCLIYKIFN